VALYSIRRGQNVYIIDEVFVSFPNEEEARAVVENSPADEIAGEITGYDGKAKPFRTVSMLPAVLSDRKWFITRVDGVGVALPEYDECDFDDKVTTRKLIEFVEELSKLDPDWPFDRRMIRTMICDAKEIVATLARMGSN
jgi:hypothetical protein